MPSSEDLIDRGHGGEAARDDSVKGPRTSSRHEISGGSSQGQSPPVDTAGPEAGPPDPERSYRGMPVVYLAGDPPEPAPFLMNADEVSRLFRLADSKTKFPRKTVRRYRRLGLRTVRVGRRVWFRLDDVLRFLDRQQSRLAGEKKGGFLPRPVEKNGTSGRA